MKVATWGVVWAWATHGATARGDVVAHAFVPESSAPVCEGQNLGDPGPFASVRESVRCLACLRLVVSVRLELAPVRSLRVWSWALTSTAGTMRGVAETRDAADAAARAAAASLGSVAISITTGEGGAAAEFARELVAEARARRPAPSTTATEPVASVFRLAVAWDPEIGRATARTETARVVKRTPRLVFVERSTRMSGGGAAVVSSIALPREALERGEIVRGWSLREPSAEDICAALAPFGGGGQAIPSWASALGLSWPCDAAAAKRAFRLRARTAHPDAGGSSAEFKNLAAAFGAAEAFFERGGR